MAVVELILLLLLSDMDNVLDGSLGWVDRGGAGDKDAGAPPCCEDSNDCWSSGRTAADDGRSVTSLFLASTNAFAFFSSVPPPQHMFPMIFLFIRTTRQGQGDEQREILNRLLQLCCGASCFFSSLRDLENWVCQPTCKIRDFMEKR